LFIGRNMTLTMMANRCRRASCPVGTTENSPMFQHGENPVD
jgi:hypothetical protein